MNINESSVQQSRTQKHQMITSNYRAQMDENKKAVDENQLKLQKLMELEQELTQNIQRNIEKKYDLMRS